MTGTTDVIALGEVMLRFDPGEGRIRTTRTFHVWEGGGEYNVVRGLRRCFGLRTAIVTALTDNPVGRLVEDLILQGGVDTSHIRWALDNHNGRTTRNGLNFVERGYGIRGALGVSDRTHTATSQLRRGDIDWDTIFSGGVRWFHTGGIFAALSDTTLDVADEAMTTARRHGVTVSYDPNYRPSLWANRGGAAAARQVDLHLARHADVVVGALGLAGTSPEARRMNTDEVPDALADIASRLPTARVLATTLREVPSAAVNDWSSAAWSPDTGYVAGPHMPGLHILDRIGSGDSFAAGLIHGLLTGDEPWPGPLTVAHLERALAYGTAHGAHTMTTPGDTSMATLTEVEALMAGGTAAVSR
ncbi:sugar kinase [Streptomyces sp. WI04-05B]|uniref:sugar kinase n=1 Tax=Streptomyces TaxID=1883 RepID=UPI0029B5A2FA|nr:MULTISPECIES: sugar kinase [unclassified Streptomyces]MDX2546227.1 sugar kinase [Streptomyces sp. WI04-05B]MDX2583250.1 sugar kinase [Streptomyces sp. WI04-05A]MDX3745017.1 sugar kinase [Streptomyces sp. AK08-02]